MPPKSYLAMTMVMKMMHNELNEKMLMLWMKNERVPLKVLMVLVMITKNKEDYYDGASGSSRAHARTLSPKP